MKKGLIVLALICLALTTYGKESVLKIMCDQEEASIYLNGKFATRWYGPDVEVNLDEGKYNLTMRKDLDDGSYYFYEKQYEFGEFSVRVIADVKMELRYSEKYYYKGAKMTGDISFYEEYIKKYPNGIYAKEFVEYLDGYYLSKSDDINICKKYVEIFPRGKNIKIIKAKLESLEYEEFVKTKNISLGEKYLDKYPKGKFADKIKTMIEELMPRGIVDVYPKVFAMDEPIVIYFSTKKSKDIWKYRKILRRKDLEINILPEQMYIRFGFNGWEAKYLKKDENDPAMELAEEMGTGVWKYSLMLPIEDDIKEINLTFKDEFNNWDTNIAKDYLVKVIREGSTYKVVDIIR